MSISFAAVSNSNSFIEKIMDFSRVGNRFPQFNNFKNVQELSSPMVLDMVEYLILV
jgi:hypothetical protein